MPPGTSNSDKGKHFNTINTDTPAGGMGLRLNQESANKITPI